MTVSEDTGTHAAIEWFQELDLPPSMTPVSKLGFCLLTLHSTGTDRYERTLAHVTAGDIEVDAQMIVTGPAWHYRRYDHTAAPEAAERNARAARRGLWADGEPVPPWGWRAGERERNR